MMDTSTKCIDCLIVDTTAFIQNVPLREVGKNIITCQEVVNEVTNKKQLRRLIVLPYDLIVKDVFPENVKIITDFAKKTGDYPSLSATDIKVMALTYQLEKEKVGISHLRTEPVQKPIVTVSTKSLPDMKPDITGFVLPASTEVEVKQHGGCYDKTNTETSDVKLDDEKLAKQFKSLECTDNDNISDSYDVLSPISQHDEETSFDDEREGDEDGWITPSNIQMVKKRINSEFTEDKNVTVACMTSDFAMQNVLRQINLNVASLDGRIIKQLRNYVLRCYTCFKITSIMTKKFCPKCGNNTLKKVAVSLDESGKLQIHINTKRPLSARGKKFSLPRIKGGKHPNNPILVEDQPMAHNRPSRLARTVNNPLDEDYIAGFSPFVMRDVNSKSAQLCIRPGYEYKHLLSRNSNEIQRKNK
ncbi:hypothetical protein NQ315_014425 [Exocentrus adspersus]|uniref:RNA-binding protein NOB1 n=1 Tax=Exocentrus adspersus TaxID=1586481 RepID=A0AAV8VB66_9CUCU|nr:hypothetical protein NQ315_014425 [Exocentrus adspersus]